MSGEAQSSIWPLPVFHFEVKIGTEKWSFQEVTGLESKIEVLEYRHGKSKQPGNMKMPGRISVSDVTLKKGVFTGDTKLFDWFKKDNKNIIARKTITISLLNELHRVEFSWTLLNAFPIEIKGPTLKADGNDIAVEEIVLSHEELDIKTGII